jgi:hypothetical protein
MPLSGTETHFNYRYGIEVSILYFSTYYLNPNEPPVLFGDATKSGSLIKRAGLPNPVHDSSVR